ncbi:MAG: sigma-70 family RNA polymerase sigma factor [Aggregatilineales bacterium]
MDEQQQLGGDPKAASELDERALVARLKARDPAALAALFERSADRIYRLALSLLRDEQAADDVVQNTFVALIDAIDTFEGRARLDSWLYRVAYNDALSRLRAQKPLVPLNVPDDGEALMPANLIDWTTLPEELLTDVEVRAEMERAIATLTPVQRAVFVLRDIEGFSTRETADSLGLSEANVKVALHRARLALREHLAGYFERQVR